MAGAWWHEQVRMEVTLPELIQTKARCSPTPHAVTSSSETSTPGHSTSQDRQLRRSTRKRPLREICINCSTTRKDNKAGKWREGMSALWFHQTVKAT